MPEIEICICASQERSIIDVVDSLSKQEEISALDLQITIINRDNRPQPSGSYFEDECLPGLKINRIRTMSDNLSTARNIFLAASTAEWIVFVGEGQFADRNWLNRLTATRGNADFVIGFTHALITKKRVPKWMAHGEFHSKPIGRQEPKSINWANNILMRRSFLDAAALRFAESSAGASEALFMHDARKANARLNYALDAVMYEEVPDNQASMSYLLREHFCRGKIQRCIDNRDEAPQPCTPSHHISETLKPGNKAFFGAQLSNSVVNAVLNSTFALGYLSSPN